MAKSTDGSRLDSLTGLRMLAAFAVFGSHLPAPPPTTGLDRELQRFLASGYNGVTLFFILSGFVLTWNYVERLGAHPSGRGVWSFFVARFARVYPMYAFGLLLAVAPRLFDGSPLPNMWTHVFAMQAWATDLDVVQAYNGPGWSVGVEAFLYLCFPILIVLAQPLRRRVGPTIAVSALVVIVYWAAASWFQSSGRAGLTWAAPGSDYRWLYREPVTRLGDFVLGICAALLVMAAPKRHPGWWGTVAQYLGIASVVALMAYRPMLGSVWSWDVGYMVPMFLLILGLGLSRGTLMSRALSTKTAVLLGEASYAFYLLHHVMLGWFGDRPATTLAGWAGEMAMRLFVISCTAVGAHYLLEQPARRWLRRVLDRTPAPRTSQVPEPERNEVAPQVTENEA